MADAGTQHPGRPSWGRSQVEEWFRSLHAAEAINVSLLQRASCLQRVLLRTLWLEAALSGGHFSRTFPVWVTPLPMTAARKPGCSPCRLQLGFTPRTTWSAPQTLEACTVRLWNVSFGCAQEQCWPGGGGSLLSGRAGVGPAVRHRSSHPGPPRCTHSSRMTRVFRNVFNKHRLHIMVTSTEARERKGS